jgi:nicotinamide-nucleotide amidase
MDAQLYSLAERVGQALLVRGERLATAESCTGGGVAHALTEIAGSSAWFERGFVTYSNEAKIELLGVHARTLSDCGAVSAETVAEMLAGTLAKSRAQWALAISGIAGPSGGSPEKPVGTVVFGWQEKGGLPVLETCRFDGDRAAVRSQSVHRALEGLLALIAIEVA